MRKIIQIAATEAEGIDMLYALCEDGSLWYMNNPHPGKSTQDWSRVPSVPRESDDDPSEDDRD